MTVKIRFERCVGSTLDDAWLIARRYETRQGKSGPVVDPKRSEHWVVRLVDGEIAAIWGTRARLEGLFSCEDGSATIFARRAMVSGFHQEKRVLFHFTSADRAISVAPVTLPELEGAVAPGRATAMARALALTGIVTSGQVTLFDGGGFEVLPPSPLASIELIDGDRHGLLATSGRKWCLWDGHGWTDPDSLGASIWSIYVPEPGSLFRALAATSAQTSEVHAYDGQRWRTLCEAPEPIEQFVSHHGDIYAFGYESSYRLVEDALVQQPNLGGGSAHAGGALIVTDDDRVRSDDGREITLAGFEAMLENRRPLWRTRAIDTDRRAFSAEIPRERAPGRPVRYHFRRCEGAGFERAFFLAARSDDVERHDANEGESVIGTIADGLIADVTTLREPVHDMSVGAGGRAYLAVASSASGIVRVETDLRIEPLQAPSMQRVFALDDDCVIAWANDGEGQRFHLFEGGRGRRIPSPPGRVVAVHGCAPDWLVAVGYDGLIARWDGSAWRKWPLPFAGALGTALVVSPDEMYALGPGGFLFQGTQHGWVELAPTGGTGVGLAKFADHVYVGDPVNGLLRLDRRELAPVEIPAWPRHLHASSEGLVMVERDGFTLTRDLETITRLDALDLAIALRDLGPSWR